MSCLGVHFALSPVQEQHLLVAADDDEAVIESLEQIEDAWDDEHVVETDKAWDAIHQCLTGALEFDAGAYPLSHAVLGGRHLYQGEDFIVSYVTAEQAQDVSAALAPIDEAWFRERLFALDLENYAGPHDEDDFGYTWQNFQDLRRFYEQAVADGRAVIFTVDQ